jgi:serine phosphatase RsbU (regulator of sigma subunit)
MSPARLRTRVAVVVVVGALLVATGVALLLSNTLELRRDTQATTRSDNYLVRVLNVEGLVVDVETGLRGFVITDRPVFLEPLHRAQTELPAAESALRRAAAANHADEHRSEALIASVRSYVAGYVVPLLATARRDPGAARSLALTLEGKRLVDSIRAQTAALQGSVSASELERQLAAHGAADRSITEAIVVLVVLTLLTIALGVILGRVAVERDRARQRSQAASETLQRGIVPAALPAIPGCELAVRFLPNSDLVGGDFYDAFQTSPQSWALIIGDVAGKGVSAAALTSMARWTLRGLLEWGATPAEALRMLNDTILRQELDRRFVTAACLQFSQRDGRLAMTVVCAGHPPPILVPAHGPPRALESHGTLLGVLAEIELNPVNAELGEGDAIVAYTDGVTDQGPEEGIPPEQALAGRPPGADAEALADALERLSRVSAGPYRDDVAILALRFVDPAANASGGGARARSGESGSTIGV